MYAVVQLGSHQYKVSPGDIITVEKLDGIVGSEVKMKRVLMVADGEKVIVGKEVKATVVGKIKAQEKGSKIHVFKKIRRKGFHKTIGHRQTYTRVEILRVEE